MSSPIQHKDQEATLISTQDDLDKALPVDWSESGSSQSAGTTFVAEADEAIMSAAFVSMQDRRSRLTSLLHHLTVDREAPDQQLLLAGLPASWAREPPQTRGDDDRTLQDLQNRPAGSYDVVPSANGSRIGWQFVRFFVITGVTAALVGWGTVLLLGARTAGNETVQAVNPPAPVAASVLGYDSLPQENTEPPVAANVQYTTGVPPPTVHDNNPPQENTEPAVTAKVQSAAGVPVPALTHDRLPQGGTEPSFAANVQAARVVPPRVYDNPAQDNKPPLRAAETSPDQAPKLQLSQSLGSSLMLDADEIAALVKRGKDFVTNGDLVSARLPLRRAAEAGSAEAALALGETFDPVVFQRLHVIGIEPDAARAQKWYRRATELRSAAASQHFAKPPSSPLNDEAKKTEIPPSSQLNDEAKKAEVPQSSQLNDESVIKKAKATIAAKMSDPNSVEFENIERAARNNALGNSIEAICGIVWDKNSGPRRFLYLVQTNEAYIGGYAVATSEYRNTCSANESLPLWQRGSVTGDRR
jgi:TPR repeat protein